MEFAVYSRSQYNTLLGSTNSTNNVKAPLQEITIPKNINSTSMTCSYQDYKGYLSPMADAAKSPKYPENQTNNRESSKAGAIYNHSRSQNPITSTSTLPHPTRNEIPNISGKTRSQNQTHEQRPKQPLHIDQSACRTPAKRPLTVSTTSHDRKNKFSRKTSTQRNLSSHNLTKPQRTATS